MPRNIFQFFNSMQLQLLQYQISFQSKERLEILKIPFKKKCYIVNMYVSILIFRVREYWFAVSIFHEWKTIGEKNNEIKFWNVWREKKVRCRTSTYIFITGSGPKKLQFRHIIKQQQHSVNFQLYKKMHITNYLQNLILQICPDFYKKKLMKHFWWNLKPLSMSLVCTVGWTWSWW